MVEDFRDRWLSKEESMNLSDVLKARLIPYKDILLPDSAAPYLSFTDAEHPELQNEYYGGGIDSNLYILIGSDGSGDPVCEEVKTGRVYLLDHEDGFKKLYFMNSSLECLAECLLAFLGEKDPKQAYTNISNIDLAAVQENCFWLSAINEM